MHFFLPTIAWFLIYSLYLPVAAANGNEKTIINAAANLFINSLLDAGVQYEDNLNNVIKLNVERITCEETLPISTIPQCTILFQGSTLLAKPEQSQMLLRVLRGNGVRQSPAVVSNVHCVRPQFPYPLGRCTFVD